MDILLFVVSMFILISILVTTVASFSFLVFVFYLIKEAFSQKKKEAPHVAADFVSPESRLAV